MEVVGKIFNQHGDMQAAGVMRPLGSVVCSDDLEAGIGRLHYELFGTVNYIPSNTVAEISEEIDVLVDVYLPEDKDIN